LRLVRVDHARGPRYGVLADDEQTVDLLTGDPFDAISLSGETTTVEESALMVPVTPTKVVGVGRNYAAHAAEMGLPLGAAPSVFLKPLQTLLDPDGDVVLPPPDVSGHVEHEAEIAVVIGRTARNVSPEEAIGHVLGLTCADDVSARDLQRSDPQLTRGKGFDTFCPLGAWIETDALDERHEITCHVNGELRQKATTADLLFPIPYLVAWISSWTTLVPGDVILTGSPAGTAPLAPGDVVDIEISGRVALRHGVTGSRGAGGSR
jgi:2-keto-4-pentenoate hydratase/2-oxohepta-3-ene-1,7-dioic acid hydratase in catechol pathway